MLSIFKVLSLEIVSPSPPMSTASTLRRDDTILWTFQWRDNERDSVSYHQSHDCLLIRLFRRRWKKHQSSTSLAFVMEIHRWQVNTLHKGPVTRKTFPFDDIIMTYQSLLLFGYYQIIWLLYWSNLRDAFRASAGFHFGCLVERIEHWWTY